MARIRSVKPELCESETMARLSAEVERTFVRLWTHCDDEGRCKDDPRLIKAALFPLHDDVTAAVVNAHLAALEAERLIVRYQADGKRYLACRSWAEHQHPQKPRPSKFPAPPDPLPEPSRTCTGEVRDTYGPVVGEVDVEGEVVSNPSPSSESVALALVEPAPPPTAAPGKYPDDFATWWDRYPRKVGKGAAAKAYQRAKRRTTAKHLTEALDAHAAAWEANRTEPQYIPHPETWLSQARYDDPAPPITGPPGHKGSVVDRNQARIRESLARAQQRATATGGAR